LFLLIRGENLSIKIKFNDQEKNERVCKENKDHRRNAKIKSGKDKSPQIIDPIATQNIENNFPQQQNIQAIFEELNSLIGLSHIKKLVEEIYAYVEIQKKRIKENLKSDGLVLHMIFKGNPGTGKTTVARLLGRLFKELNVLPKGHVVEVERADLVGEYIGHTALKTKEIVKKSLGGVLFIDEAYSLARGGEKDFGREAIDVLVKAMEDYKNSFILILAGYREEMDLFMKMNPGLRSRLPIQIEFPDYHMNELLEIAKVMLDIRQYKLDEEAFDELRIILENYMLLGHCKEGNARLVRNIIEKSTRLQAMRLINQGNLTKEDLITIKRVDLVGANILNVK
jgi:stage V sporulation protein K